MRKRVYLWHYISPDNKIQIVIEAGNKAAADKMMNGLPNAPWFRPKFRFQFGMLSK